MACSFCEILYNEKEETITVHNDMDESHPQIKFKKQIQKSKQYIISLGKSLNFFIHSKKS